MELLIGDGIFHVHGEVPLPSHVPIFRFPCSTAGDDFKDLCHPDQRGNLMLTVSSDSLEELYDAQLGLFIIFHHRDHPYTIRFRF